MSLKVDKANKGHRTELTGVVKNYVLPHRVTIGTKSTEAVVTANNKEELRLMIAGLSMHEDTLSIVRKLLFIGNQGKLFLRKKGFLWAARQPDFRLTYGKPKKYLEFSTSVDKVRMVIYLNSEDFNKIEINTVYNPVLVGIFRGTQLNIGSFKPVFAPTVPPELKNTLKKTVTILEKKTPERCT